VEEQAAAYYLILASLAMVYLAVQATSAERVFSMAFRIINNRCNRLDPTMAGKMLFVSKISWTFIKQLKMMMKLK
jgi:hAT family C-terminal dimerisation region